MRSLAISIGAAFALLPPAPAAAQEEREILCGGCVRSLFARLEPGESARFFRGETELGAAVAGADGWAVLRSAAAFEPGELRVVLGAAGDARSARFVLPASDRAAREAPRVRFEAWIEESALAGAPTLVWRARLPKNGELFGRPGALGELAIRTERGRAVHRSAVSIDAEACARGRWSLPREAAPHSLVLAWRCGDAEVEGTSRVADALVGVRAASREVSGALEIDLDRTVIAEDEVFDLRGRTFDDEARAVGRWIAWQLGAGSEVLAEGRVLTAMALGTAAWSIDPPRDGALLLRVRREDGRGRAFEREVFVSGARDSEPLRWLDEPGAWRVGREVAVRWRDRDGAGAGALVLADGEGRFLEGLALPPARGARRAIVRPAPTWEREVELVLVSGTGATLRRRQSVDRPLDVSLEPREGDRHELRVDVRDAEGRPAHAALAFACHEASAESRCRFADAAVRLDAKGGAWIALPPALAGRFFVRAFAVDRDGREGSASLELELESNPNGEWQPVPPRSAALRASGWGEWIGEGAVALPPLTGSTEDFELELAAAAAPALWAEEQGRDEERSDLLDVMAQARAQLEIAAAWPRGASGRSEVVIAARARARRAFERLACAWDELGSDERALRIRELAARMLQQVDERSGPIDEEIRRALEDLPVTGPVATPDLPSELRSLARALALESENEQDLAAAFAAAIAWNARTAAASVRLARAELLFAAERRAACAPSAGCVDVRWNDRSLCDRLDLWGPARRIEVPRSYAASDGRDESLVYSAEGRPRVLWRIWSRSR